MSDFIVHLKEVPLTRTTQLRLQKLAKARSLTEEAAAGHAIEQYMQDQGDRQIRIDAAQAIADRHRTE